MVEISKNPFIKSSLSTPLGNLIVVSDANALHLILFEDQEGLDERVARIGAVSGIAAPIESFNQELQSYFAGELFQFKTPYVLQGTAFQMAVWQALSKIPYGRACAYSDLAEEIQRPLAVRAVASAIGDNLLAILMPCHRVLRKEGLGGYAGGLFRKKWLLDHETVINNLRELSNWSLC